MCPLLWIHYSCGIICVNLIVYEWNENWQEVLFIMTDEKIKNPNELEFAVFCIENVAAKLGWMQNVSIRHLQKRAIF